MYDLNFNKNDKAIITEAENRRGYVYYEFTEESVRAIADKQAYSVVYEEWCSLLQMLYPTRLICSGLFEPFLLFDIVNGRRKDPPTEHWGSLSKPGTDGILLERFIAALEENGIKPHDSWYKVLSKSKEG